MLRGNQRGGKNVTVARTGAKCSPHKIEVSRSTSVLLLGVFLIWLLFSGIVVLQDGRVRVGSHPQEDGEVRKVGSEDTPMESL